MASDTKSRESWDEQETSNRNIAQSNQLKLSRVFRFNDPQPGLPTDYWLVQCHPSPSVSQTNPANWGNEIRVTSRSFNMEKAWAPFLSYFVGDYEGLTAVGNDFVTVFGQVDSDNVTSVFFRRVNR